MRSFNPYPIVAIARIFISAIFLTGVLFLFRDTVANYLSTLLLLVWLVSFMYMLAAYLRSRFYSITLEDQFITYQSGILSTRKVVLPYAKITEASYSQSLPQRLFGVGTVNIDTAGGTNIAIRLIDIRSDDMKEILGEINRKGGKDSGI
jgi:uncharacterized membrane protein YdbT with pleckstrin-like domain